MSKQFLLAAACLGLCAALSSGCNLDAEPGQAADQPTVTTQVVPPPAAPAAAPQPAAQPLPQLPSQPTASPVVQPATQPTPQPTTQPKNPVVQPPVQPPTQPTTDPSTPPTIQLPDPAQAQAALQKLKDQLSHKGANTAIDNTPDDVDKPMSGHKTSGDELIGAYTCQLSTNDFPLGIQPPAAACKITKNSSGTLALGLSGGSPAKLDGRIQDPTTQGFFIHGDYSISGLTLGLKTRMARSTPGKFVGHGRGVLNNDKSAAVKYTLTMTQQ